MKKCMFTIFSIFLFFQCLTSLHASGTLTLNELSSGKINATISTTSGYVSGFDLSIKVSGNVEFDSIKWNSELKKYDTKVTYENNIIRLILTTGKQVNLLDRDGDVDLGVLVFNNKGSNSTSYSLELSSLTIIDGTYKSEVMSPLSTNNDSYQIKYEENTTSQDNPPSSEENTQNDTTDSNENYNVINQETTTNQSEEVKNEEEVENKEEKETTNKEEIITNKDIQDEETTTDNKKSSNILIKILIPVIIVLVAISFVIYVRKSNEQERRQGL